MGERRRLVEMERVDHVVDRYGLHHAQAIDAGPQRTRRDERLPRGGGPNDDEEMLLHGQQLPRIELVDRLVERFEKDQLGIPPAEVAGEHLPEQSQAGGVIGVVLEQLLWMVVVHIDDHREIMSHQPLDRGIDVAERNRIDRCGCRLLEEQGWLNREPHAAEPEPMDQLEVAIAHVRGEVHWQRLLWSHVAHGPEPARDVYAPRKTGEPRGGYALNRCLRER